MPLELKGRISLPLILGIPGGSSWVQFSAIGLALALTPHLFSEWMPTVDVLWQHTPQPSGLPFMF